MLSNRKFIDSQRHGARYMTNSDQWSWAVASLKLAPTKYNAVISTKVLCSNNSVSALGTCHFHNFSIQKERSCMAVCSQNKCPQILRSFIKLRTLRSQWTALSVNYTMDVSRASIMKPVCWPLTLRISRRSVLTSKLIYLQNVRDQTRVQGWTRHCVHWTR